MCIGRRGEWDTFPTKILFAVRYSIDINTNINVFIINGYRYDSSPRKALQSLYSKYFNHLLSYSWLIVIPYDGRIVVESVQAAGILDVRGVAVG